MKDRLLRKILVFILFFLFFGASLGSGFVTNISINSNKQKSEHQILPVLPRWREEGTPYDENQPLYPYMIKSRDVPTSGNIKSPPEYNPVKGVLFWYNTGHWNEVVSDLVVALTQDSDHDEIAYVVVTSEYQKNSAITEFTSQGADMDKVEFFIEPGNSVWIRDYGPHFIFQDDAICIVDSHYYAQRYLDNFIPTLLGDDHFIMPTYDMGLFYSGGNFQPGPDNSGFVTSLINTDNPPSQGFDEAYIAELYKTYQGIEELHILPQLPGGVDGTGHIDMWMYLVDEDTVIISEFKPGSNQQAIDITNNAVDYMEDLGFEVYRTPAWNSNHPDNNYWTHWTYTNSFRVNDRIFIPTFGETYPDYADEDQLALNAFSIAAGPGVEIVQIDCFPIIWAAGAIHCIVMQVPKSTKSHPVVHVIHPNGGELFASGTAQKIQWVATDTNNNEIPQFDLYFSADGGNSYELINTTLNTGFYDWEVPEIDTKEAKIKIVAISQDDDEGEAECDDSFEISYAVQSVYDYSFDAGTNKFCRGYQTSGWSEIEGERTPVTQQISSGDYEKIAYSDAIGGNSDTNRYKSPYPSGYSTHIFEFKLNEDASDIGDIEFLWEGYADSCTQVELYVWDYIQQHWGNAEGLYNQNRYMDCWAGNRDGYLKQNIRSNFYRYVSNNKQMTFLVQTDRPHYSTLHDYASLTITNPLDSAELFIDTIKGGFFKINTAIKNIGYFNATNVSWTITLNGGIIFTGKETSGKITNIQSNERIEISSKPIIGVGKTTVEVNTDLDVGTPDTRNQDATLLLFLINVKPGG